MNQSETMDERFEPHRSHLRAVAFRMLGSAAEADDAVQETWLRFNRANTGDVVSLRAWLTTVVSRVCLNLLRARRSGLHETLGPDPAAPAALAGRGDVNIEPEEEAVLIDSVGRALLVVLDRLGPAERLAFVLHDLFAVPFDEIAPVVDRTPATTKKLASRARQRVQGGGTATRPAELHRQKQVASAFLAASRQGDLQGLLAVLDPDVVRRADPPALPAGAPAELRGAEEMAKETVSNTRLARVADLALVDGAVGIVVAPGGALAVVLRLAITDARITQVDVVADPADLAHTRLAPLPPG